MSRFRVMIVGDDDEGRDAIRTALIESPQSTSVEIVPEKRARTSQDAHPHVIICDLDHCESKDLQNVKNLLGVHPTIRVFLLYSDHEQVEAVAQTDFPRGVEVMQKFGDQKVNARRVAALIDADASPARQRSGESETMRQRYQVIERLGKLDCHVLITGETGSGKDWVARKLHERGHQSGAPLVKIPCAALEPEAFEAQWRRALAQEEGSTQGAVPAGTLMLDRVDELPLGTQAVLLRLLDEFEDSESAEAPRLICTASEQLDTLVAKGRFRTDLLYRLRVATIQLVPLRSRREDIVSLVKQFVAEQAPRLNPNVTAISPVTLQALSVYEWPGNVRELRNVIEDALIGCDGDELHPRHLPATVRSGAGHAAGHATATAAGRTPATRGANVEASAAPHASAAAGEGPLPADLKSAVRDFERLLIVRAIRECGGNRDDAARRLNISKATLYRKLDGYRPEL